MLRIDGHSQTTLLNRYLAYSEFIKFDDTIPDEKWDNNNPKAKYRKRGYHVEWANVKEDVKGVLRNPFKFAPQIAYSLAAFWFILKGQHDSARLLAFTGSLAWDADSTVAAVTGSTTTITNPHTTSGSNRIILGMVAEAGNGVSSFQYNTSDLTLGLDVPGPNEYSMHFYYLIAPTSGTHDLVYVNAANFGDNYGKLIGISFTGADQTTQLDHAATNDKGTNASSASSSLSITTSYNNSFIVDGIVVGGGVTISPGGSQTRAQNGDNFQPTLVSFGVSYKQLATAGSTTMTWSWTGNKANDFGALCVKEATGGASANHWLLMGT